MTLDLPKGRPEVPDGTWLWLQGFARWVGRNRLVALIAELDQIRGLGVLRAMRPKGA